MNSIFFLLVILTKKKGDSFTKIIQGSVENLMNWYRGNRFFWNEIPIAGVRVLKRKVSYFWKETKFSSIIIVTPFLFEGFFFQKSVCRVLRMKYWFVSWVPQFHPILSYMNVIISRETLCKSMVFSPFFLQFFNFSFGFASSFQLFWSCFWSFSMVFCIVFLGNVISSSSFHPISSRNTPYVEVRMCEHHHQNNEFIGKVMKNIFVMWHKNNRTGKFFQCICKAHGTIPYLND